MKLSDVIRVGAKTSAPTPEENVNEDTQKLDELNMNVSEIKYLLNDIIVNSNSRNPKSVSKATLTDVEVSEVLTMLEEYNDLYFKNIPLTERFTANFLWNIPRKVYDAAVKAQVRRKPVYFNPIFWFYIMCLDEPEDMIAPFIYEVIDNLNKDSDSLNAINEATKEYISTYLDSDEDEDVDVEYVDNSNEEVDEDDRYSS